MTEQAVSPLRRRMIEDMSIRKFAGKTQHDYVQRIKEFATFLGRSPHTAADRQYECLAPVTISSSVPVLECRDFS